VSSLAPAPPLTAAKQVVIENLIKQYGTLRALGGVSFDVHTGEWVALMGPSGSGKTTLINILGGLDTLTSGHVFVDGVDLSKLSESQLVRYRAEKVGFVFQQFHLVPYLTAVENVMLAQYFHSVTDERQASEALQRVGLGDRLIELAHGRLHFDTLQHGPGHPLACPLVNTADCCSNISTDDEIRFDHLLEQVWICGEEGKPALVEALRATGSAGSLPVLPDEPAGRVLGRMSELQLVELQNGTVQLTPGGSRRARDVIRRHRLAERLFKDTFAVEDSELHNQACKFEHIISPELDQRICSFLGHPKTCPHGNPIPPGDCCNGKRKD